MAHIVDLRPVGNVGKLWGNRKGIVDGSRIRLVCVCLYLFSAASRVPSNRGDKIVKGPSYPNAKVQQKYRQTCIGLFQIYFLILAW